MKFSTSKESAAILADNMIRSMLDIPPKIETLKMGFGKSKGLIPIFIPHYKRLYPKDLCVVTTMPFTITCSL